MRQKCENTPLLIIKKGEKGKGKRKESAAQQIIDGVQGIMSRIHDHPMARMALETRGWLNQGPGSARQNRGERAKEEGRGMEQKRRGTKRKAEER